MGEGLRVCLVDAGKVDGLRRLAEALMAVPGFSENGEALKYFLEELGLWETEGQPQAGDSALAARLRSIALELGQITQDRDIEVSAFTVKDGYVHMRFGDYTYVKDGDAESYNYSPMGNTRSWQPYISQEQIHIGGAPLKKRG